MAWHIIETNPQCERKAAAELRRAGLRVYMPKRQIESRHARTKAPEVKRKPVMIGYLFTRWRQAGWRPVPIVVVSALIRGTYHLYQGFGGFLSNLVFGLLLGWLYTRTKRLWPLVIAHALIDVAAFVGYSLLAGVVDWL